MMKPIANRGLAKDVLKYGILVAVIVALYYVLLGPSNLAPSDKELKFHENALVVNKGQEWEEIGDDILRLFAVPGNHDDWTFFQYFGGDEEPSDLVDLDNYKKWRQCIFRKDDRERKYWREEEWAFVDSTNQWILMRRSFFETGD